MNHQQARETLPLYADGELDSQRAAEVEAHLAESTELRDELERWRSLRRCANRVFAAPAVPPELETILRDRLRREGRGTRYKSLPLFGGITAIAAAIVVMVVLWWPTAPAPAPATAEARLVAAERFAEIYRHCAVEIRHRQVEVDLQDIDGARDTLAGLVSHPVLAPDLRETGFQLDGVCRCFHAPNVRAVHVFYRREGPEPAVVSFFSLDQKVHLKNCTCEACTAPEGWHRDYEIADSDGVTVCKWNEAANSFAVCGEMSQDQLRGLADRVKVASVPRTGVILAWGKP
jgi:anti-sigma factor RsiW